MPGILSRDWELSRCRISSLLHCNIAHVRASFLPGYGRRTVVARSELLSRPERKRKKERETQTALAFFKPLQRSMGRHDCINALFADQEELGTPS